MLLFQGVINVVCGSGRATLGAIMQSGKVDILAFIGTRYFRAKEKKERERHKR